MACLYCYMEHAAFLSHVGLETYSCICQKAVGRQDGSQCYSAVTFVKMDFFFFFLLICPAV